MRKLRGEYAVSLLCSALEVPRSSFYYRAKRGDDEEVIHQILSIACQFPRYGYRRITAELRRRGYIVNHKKVLRLMRKFNLLVRQSKKPRTTIPAEGEYPNLIKDLLITHPDQVWCGDIAYIRLKDRFAYFAFVMDVYTRAIRGWEISSSPDEELVVGALEKALEKAKPQIHHSDHGIQYLSDRYVSLLKDAGVEISMAGKGRAWENGYAERFIRTLKEEEVYLHEYEDIHDARVHIERFIEDVYMRRRVHSALGYLTPAEFEEKVLHL